MLYLVREQSLGQNQCGYRECTDKRIIVSKDSYGGKETPLETGEGSLLSLLHIECLYRNRTGREDAHTDVGRLAL